MLLCALDDTHLPSRHALSAPYSQFLPFSGERKASYWENTLFHSQPCDLDEIEIYFKGLGINRVAIEGPLWLLWAV